MATTKKNQKEKDREIVLSHLRSKPEEIFHVDEQFAFSRDEKGKRLLITHLDHGLIVEVEVPFTEEFAVEKVKMDKDRKGFTMSGWQGKVWFDLENCWKKAKPLEKPADSPFPEIRIDQEGPFSIFQEPDEFTIECPLSYVGDIKLKPGETGVFHFGSLHKFGCYPISDNTVIEYLTPVAPKDYPNPFDDEPEIPSEKDFTGEEILMNEMANEVANRIFEGINFDNGIHPDLVHVKWTMRGMCFECETVVISFNFSDNSLIWGSETDEFLHTILTQLDTFDRDNIQNMVDYFRTLEGDEDMSIIYQELVDFLKNPDWNTFLKWGFDGTFTTGELRKILENILLHSTEYLLEIGLDQTR